MFLKINFHFLAEGTTVRSTWSRYSTFEYCYGKCCWWHECR